MEGGISADFLTISCSSCFDWGMRGKSTVFLARQEGGKMLGDGEHRYPHGAQGNGACEGAEAGTGTNLTVGFVCHCISQNVNAVNRREETMTETSAGCS